MIFSLKRNTILALVCLLGGCGNMRMQSFDRFSKEMTESTYRSDRQACSRHLDSVDYRQCIKRTDEAYERLRNDLEKAAKNR